MMDVFLIVMLSLFAIVASLAVSVAIGMVFHAGSTDADENEQEHEAL